MAALASFNDYLNRATSGYGVQRHWGAEIATATAAVVGNTLIFAKTPPIYTVETMPSGVTGFRLTNASLYNSIQTGVCILAKLIDMGTLVVGTSFTDGAAMPTVTEGNSSRQINSPILVEMTTAGSGSANITITYTNQDGSSATTPSTAITTTSAAYSAGFIPLNGNDYGARDITTATRASGTGTCTLKFWGVIPLGMFNSSHQIVGTVSNLNFLTEFPTSPLLSAGDSIYLLSTPGTVRGLKGTLSFVGEQA
jgi:hypothetical protein